MIAYDASSTLAPRTGVGRAALGLLRALIEGELEPAPAGWRVFLNSLTRRSGPEHDFLKNAPRVAIIRKRRPGANLVRAWARGTGPTAEEIAGRDAALWHAPASYVPPADSMRRVATVHDLTFLDDSPAEREKLGGALFAEAFPRVLLECDAITVPSHAVRARLLETYSVPDDRVRVIPWGIDKELFAFPTEAQVEIARHHHAITAEFYLLAVSDHQPRKRIGLLLDAYACLLETEAATPPLVVLGWAGHPPRELKDRPNLHRRVHVLPRVADDMLTGIYGGAVATVITSREEGFGFPVLEAQACGSPVVCGRGGALAEIAGEAAEFVDSADPDAWRDAIARVAFDQETHDALSERGQANAARFTWAACAKSMLKLYAEVVG